MTVRTGSLNRSTRQVDSMVKAQGNDVRELAWTVAGASAGSLARHWVDPIWPVTVRALANTFILTSTAAALVGFAFAASVRGPLKAVLVAAGGAAGSISVAATRAASATPAQSVIGLGAFFVGAVVGFLLGMLVTFAVRNLAREKRT
jgi:fluoride ion exporter CrcB/FEX